MIFNAKKHKIPKFPEKIALTFEASCEALPVEAVAELRSAVQQFLAVAQDKYEQNSYFDIDLAGKVGDRCLALLDRYETSSEEERALIVGAVRYFVGGRDAISDEVFASGFTDDAKVINHVLESLGIEDLYLRI